MDVERELRASASASASSSNKNVADAAKALGIDTANKDDATLKNEIAEKLKTS
jgi:hypothetical protein